MRHRALDLLPLLNALVLATPLLIWGVELASGWAMALSKPTPTALAETEAVHSRGWIRSEATHDPAQSPTDPHTSPRVGHEHAQLIDDEGESSEALTSNDKSSAPFPPGLLGYGL